MGKKLFKLAVNAAWNMAVAAVSSLIVDTIRETYYYAKALNEVIKESQQSSPDPEPCNGEIRQAA